MNNVASWIVWVMLLVLLFALIVFGVIQAWRNRPARRLLMPSEPSSVSKVSTHSNLINLDEFRTKAKGNGHAEG